jgi:hypothetical protein
MNEFLKREEERKQEAKTARAADTDEQKRLAAEAVALRDELRDYARLTRRPEIEVEAAGEIVIVARGKMALHVMVRPDDRYSLEQKGGSILENVRVSLTKVQLDRKEMIDAVLDWVAELTSEANGPQARVVSSDRIAR